MGSGVVLPRHRWLIGGQQTQAGFLWPPSPAGSPLKRLLDGVLGGSRGESQGDF